MPMPLDNSPPDNISLDDFSRTMPHWTMLTAYFRGKCPGGNDLGDTRVVEVKTQWRLR